MVVGGSNAESDWRRYACGGLASCTAETLTFPIDLTKTRLQLQSGSGSGVQYRGMLHALYKISTEEGFRSLYNGCSPALLRQLTYGTLKMGFYKDLRSKLGATNGPSLGVDVTSGIIAGGVAAAIANPTDVAKVRMQAQSNGKYKNAIHAITTIAREEGLSGLYRGVSPTVQRACVVAGVELPAYDVSKRYFLHHKYFEDSYGLHFMCSNIAGLVGAIASNPIDVVKTRLMSQSASATGVYTGVMDCFRKTVAAEGWMALYKGFIPNYARLAPWNIAFFMSYEQYARFVGLYEY
ncbi:hypothetical protein SARC_03401 [Sphaeroforma arctica JP610]|uniref:Uncharacterized protein n=1 Tax=Sphaeroforma arctica JP610 TaxID=667725 RepID=A0A0L0G5T1_9EUKA|nr:hypothetical protein SARC_03401 [Sphaeroforma arctica JP610]KNC84385.1 hypothetical protein SARC_03401 [Sphaeroforma arctica JP610]|eukprot:XP_014158287.1 hypothetical protein SARC_03401 [Sphaeroforma arctica JP610]